MGERTHVLAEVYLHASSVELEERLESATDTFSFGKIIKSR